MEPLLIPYSPVSTLPARRVLVLAPHPDDEVFGCGGAIAAHVQAGVPVHVIILTDGGLFGDITLRLDESMAAAAVLGYGTPECWQLPDRGILFDEPLVQRVMETIRAGEFDLVYAPSLREIHPDHVQLARVALEAVRRLGAGVHLAQYEIGAPLWPSHLLDITPFVATKLQAMRCFASQLKRQAYDAQIGALNRYRSYTLPKKVKAAEAFRLLAGADLACSPVVFAGDVNAADLRQQMTMMWVYPEVQNQVVFYKEALAGVEAELARHVEALLAKDGEIARQDGVLAQQQTDIVRQAGVLAQKDGEIARQAAMLVQRDAEIARQMGELGRKNGEIAAMSGEIARINSEIAHKEGQLAERQRLVEQLQAGAAQLRADVARLEAEAAGWRDDSAMWKRGAQNLQTEVHHWQGKAEAHLGTIEEILSSRSWRITRPLRALSDIATRIRGRLASMLAK